MSARPDLLRVGDVQNGYTVIETNALGSLPLARINGGQFNAGLTVYLTSPFRPCSQHGVKLELLTQLCPICDPPKRRAAT